jgi:hypothetical protein
MCDFYIVVLYMYTVYVSKSMTLIQYSCNMQFNSLEIWCVFLPGDGS